MSFTNSPLVTYTNITKNKTPNRNHAIDTITIHCIVGQWTAKQGCDYFATTDRQCSANYVVGKDGSIGLSVEEKDRSWCSSNAANDHRAITIEVASDTKHPYAVTDAAYNALIQLVADICKRNNIKQLLWKADKNLIGQVDKQNMTVHRWFANKSCPGEYLYERHSDIAAKVNAILNAESEKTEELAKEDVLYRVQVGAYKVKANADAQLEKVKNAGFDTYMIQVDGYYKIQVGAYSKKTNADAMLAKVKAAGFSAFITTKDGKGVEASTSEPAKMSFNDLNEGDFVNFTGGKHYTSANGTKGADVGASKAKVTAKYKESSKHPIHLRAVNDEGKFISGVYGWVDLSTIKDKISEPAKMEIKVGSTVRLKKGAKTFNGGNLASFVYERNHKVKEINVDRVVITYNGIVVAAVRKSDLTVIN